MKVAFSKNLEKAPQKELINLTLAKLGRRDGLAVVLDGTGAHTTKALVSQGWNNIQIKIPNFSKDYDSLIEQGYNAEKLSLGEYLRTFEVKYEKIGLLYADYMCSWVGNKNCRPTEDMNYLFENGLMLDGSVIGITISNRLHHKNKTGFIHHQVIALMSHMTTLANKTGYTLVIHPVGGIYVNGGSMFTIILEVYKCN